MIQDYRISKKILLIDDEEEWNTLFQRAFNGTVIQVISNTNFNKQDIEDLLSLHYIHIAFVDIQKGAGKIAEARGFEIAELIRKISPKTFVFLFTDYGHKYSEEIIQNLCYPSVVNSLYSKMHKKESDIKKDVQKIFRNNIPINFDIVLKIDLDKIDFSLLGKRINKEEILNLIGMLFFANSDIALLDFQPLDSGKSNTNVFRVIPLVNNNGTYEAGALRPINNVVVKFGPRDVILKESANFDRYVKWYLEDKQRVSKDNYCESSKNIAGVLYSFAGAKTENVQSFSQLFRDNTLEISSLQRIISSIFDPDAQDWYSRRGKDEDNSIFGYYNSILNLRSDVESKLDDFLETKRAKDTKIRFSGDKDHILLGTSIQVSNPVNYLHKRMFADVDYQTCIIHGDLHAENILINKNLEWILIDYASVERGHVYNDFVSLELSIRANLMPSAIPLEMLYEMEIRLITESGICDFENSDIEKACACLKTIRQMAYQNFGKGNRFPAEPMLNYYIALLFKCMHVFRFNLKPNNKQHILLLAGILCDHIDQERSKNSA